MWIAFAGRVTRSSQRLVHRVRWAMIRRWRAARLSRWPAEGCWRRTPFGFWMFLKPTGFFDPLYAYDAPDAAFPKLVRRLVRAGDWAIDVGGEKGWNALTLWRAAGEMKLVAAKPLTSSSPGRREAA